MGNLLLESNWLTPYKIRKLMVTGSEAIATINYITQKMTIETSNQTITPRHDWEEPLKKELDHFVKSIQKKTKPIVTGFDGLKALKIAESVLKSARTGRLIKIEY